MGSDRPTLDYRSEGAASPEPPPGGSFRGGFAFALLVTILYYLPFMPARGDSLGRGMVGLAANAALFVTGVSLATIRGTRETGQGIIIAWGFGSWLALGICSGVWWFKRVAP